MLSNASTLGLKNYFSSIANSWYCHAGMVSSSQIPTPDDGGSPNLLAELQSDLSMAPDCGIVMLKLHLKIALILILSCISWAFLDLFLQLDLGHLTSY